MGIGGLIMKLERAYIEDLNVGDVIAVPYPVCKGWSYFRYQRFEEHKVAIITPKKTKLVTDKGHEIKRGDFIYKPNEETERQTKVSKAFIFIKDFLFDLTSPNYSKIEVRALKDETILKLYALMKEAWNLIEDDINEQQAK